MKIRLLASALVLFPLLFTPVRAEDFVWAGHGVLTIEIPAGWDIEGRPTGESAFSLRGTPKSPLAALLQITLLAPPPGHPVSEAFVQKQLQVMSEQFVAGSVEGKADIQPLQLAQGYGWSVQFTDARLVGKPPVPNDYKMMRNVLIGLDAQTVVIASLQFDDPATAEAAGMSALLSSMRFKRAAPPPLAAPAALSFERVKDTFEITVPQSKLVLTMAQNDLVYTPAHIGGATNNPRYFYLVGPLCGVTVSGWFESGDHFKGIKDFWANEAKGLVSGGFTAPKNVTFLKSGDWEVVSYEMPLPGTTRTSANIRAELVQEGTWIDLHYSLTSDLSASAARDALLAILKTNQVRKK